MTHVRAEGVPVLTSTGDDRSALTAKREALYALLADFPGLIVAYSGGVDSAYLAYAATGVLQTRALCITAESPSYPERHRALAVKLAVEFGFHHEFITTDETSRPEYRANPANRCYFCKHELYTHLVALSRERGYPVIVWLQVCPLNKETGKPEVTLLKAIAGKDSFYVVQKAFRFQPDKAQIEQWSRYLRGVSVCDSRVPERACPQTK